jgi:parvulin-like peptidyl-prolyl isomerase
VRVKFLTAVSFGAAFLAGFLCGNALCRSISCRSAIGILFGRGRLIALAHGSGIYEQDVLRRAQELRYLNGVDDKTGPAEETKSSSILASLVANAAVSSLARSEKIPRLLIDRQYSLLQSQFRDRKTSALSLLANRFSLNLFRRQIGASSRAQRWIDRQLAGQIGVTAEESQQYYEMNRKGYLEPIRFRASHLFLAAPPETQPEIIEAKRLSIEALSARIIGGENLAELVTLFSEDNATRTHGGDLGFFSEFRMLSEFIAPIMNMHVGEIGPVVRTRLGFHIVQLTDLRGARQLSFDEVRLEISLVLENEKRRTAVPKLVASVLEQVDFVP